MSSEALSPSEFLRKFTTELHANNAAIFAGAGLSQGSGYVNWKGLLDPIIRDLGLDPDKEHDLVTLAQYSCNKSGGSKTELTQAIFSSFASVKHPTENHQILARLPIHTYWTTNYDKLIEKALEAAKKVPDVKYNVRQLSVTRPERDVAVYKMHGDIDNPADAIICKDDYEKYSETMGPFVTALRGDLVEKTFLFLGFSFTDPNIDYILSRVRNQFEKNQRHHYCIQKRVKREQKESKADFQYRQLKQDYFIRDLKRFSVFTCLVDDYPDITGLLKSLEVNYKKRSIFISGSAAVFTPWSDDEAQLFIHSLAKTLSSHRNRIITGFGLGVGSAVINGTLEHLNETGKTVSDEELVMRPFPQVATGTIPLPEQWKHYRQAMIEYAGIAIFLFGNKKIGTGSVELASGMEQEFELCLKNGVLPIPVGATGYVAEALWSKISNDIGTYFPGLTPDFKKNFESLGKKTASHKDLISSVTKLVKSLQAT